MFKDIRFNRDSILDVRTHFKPTVACVAGVSRNGKGRGETEGGGGCKQGGEHSPGVTNGFIKGEALGLLRTNSSEISFEENMRNFAIRLKNRDYPATVDKHL